MARTHDFVARVVWTGNTGQGTADYRAYARDHEVHIDGKPVLAGSADPAFRGDATRHNPEDLLLASISACHMLWFLHLASDAGLIVTTYEDAAEATMQMNPDGSGEFTSATLRPLVTAQGGTDPAQLEELHHKAHSLCFIARSLNFPVTVSQPE